MERHAVEARPPRCARRDPARRDPHGAVRSTRKQAARARERDRVAGPARPALHLYDGVAAGQASNPAGTIYGVLPSGCNYQPVNGQPFCAQIERSSTKQPLALRISHNGSVIQALVLSPRAAELYKLMPYKAPPDMSRFVLSPMPGLLVDVSVQPGQKVQAGERVAVIEAMKIEIPIVAPERMKVEAITIEKGQTVKTGQVLFTLAPVA